MARPSHDGVHRPKSANVVSDAMRCMSFERDAGAIDGADERADAGACDAIDGDAGIPQRANDADVSDAAGEASGEREADAAGDRRWGVAFRRASARSGPWRCAASSEWRRVTSRVVLSCCRSF